MPTTLPSRTDGTAGTASRLKGWMFVAYCVALVVVCSLLVVNGIALIVRAVESMRG